MSAGLPEAPVSRLRLRPLSVLVLVAVVVLSFGTYAFTRHVVSDQEHRQLAQRTDEAGLYVSSLITSAIQSEFASLAGTVAASGGEPQTFLRSTRLLTAVPGGFRTLALLRPFGSDAQVLAQSGVRLPATLGPDRLSAVRSVAAAPGLTGAMAATRVFKAGAGSHLGFAYATPTLRGLVVYGESDIHPEAQSSATNGQPFEELYAAIYAGTTPTSSQLIAVTGGPKTQLPLTGDVATSKIKVGVGTSWLIVAKPRHPLVGSLANETPWFLLAAVVFAGILTLVVVEVLARRREYALAVADERTEELKESMTELAAAQEQLVRSERLAAIGELASTIGHELRNPLAVISNAVYLIRGDLGPTPTEAASRHVATAEREVSAATVIVSDLLEFARQRDPVRVEVDLGGLVEEVASVLPPPTGVQLRRALPAEAVRVSVDRDMIRQVLLNLVGNAYQAMPEGGEVTVSASVDSERVVLTVADDGVGMAPDVSARIFEPFYTTKARGVGLGLAVTRRMVEAHGGDIGVRSEPGVGTTFSVTLPRGVRPDVEPVAVPAQAAPPAIETAQPVAAEGEA